MKKARMDLQQSASSTHVSDTEEPIPVEDEPNIHVHQPCTPKSPEVCIVIYQNEMCHTNQQKKDQEIDELKKLVEKLNNDQGTPKARFQRRKKRFFSWKSLNNDKKVKTFTGIPSKAALDAIYKLLETKASKLTYWHGILVTSQQKGGNLSHHLKHLDNQDLCHLKMNLF